MTRGGLRRSSDAPIASAGSRPAGSTGLASSPPVRNQGRITMMPRTSGTTATNSATLGMATASRRTTRGRA
eukprot:2867010-Pyramimonas_sp.AAC.1